VEVRIPFGSSLLLREGSGGTHGGRLVLAAAGILLKGGAWSLS
jgi:hypothetical protein